MSRWTAALPDPLRVTGSSLRPELLLAAKLIALGLLFKGYILNLPAPFAPLLAPLEHVPDGIFRQGSRLVFAAGVVSILAGFRPRVGCLALGLVLLFAVLASRVYYRNAIVYTSLVLIFAALAPAGRPPRLLRLQIALVYVAAGLNKLLDPDWRSGRFFDHFLGEVHGSVPYDFAAPLLPPLALAQGMCWWVIAAETAAGLCLVFARTQPLGLWLAGSVHVGAMLLTGADYEIFLTSLIASYFAFASWPREAVAILDPARPAQRLLRAVAGRLDRDRIWRWEEATDGGRTPRVDTEAGRSSGLGALGRIFVWTPALFAALVVSLTVLRGDWNRFAVRAAGVAMALVLVLAIPAVLRSLRARNAPGVEAAVRA